MIKDTTGTMNIYG